MESRLQTEKLRMDSEILLVETKAQLHHSMFEEPRLGIHMPQSQDNQIVGEATDLFNGMSQELNALSKRIFDNTLPVQVVKVSFNNSQKGVSVLAKRIDEINKAEAAITTSLKDGPLNRELHLHAQTMEEQMQRVAKINTGLTTAMEGYKLSEFSLFDFRRSSTVAGHSGTQYIHPERKAAVNLQSPSVSSLNDTGSDYSWHNRLRGKAGCEAGGGATGGADGGASGGEGGGAAKDPPPPSDQPSDPGGTGRRYMSRQQRCINELELAKPIKIKETKKFHRNADKDFDTWWVLVQVYIEDQPEKFPKDERTIDWIEYMIHSYSA
jgi:hypothetical protein